MSMTPVPISIRLVRAPTEASSGNGEPSWRAKWWTRKYAPSAPSSSAATASSIDCSRLSDAVRTCDAGDGVQCPKLRNPIFFMMLASTMIRPRTFLSRHVGDRRILARGCRRAVASAAMPSRFDTDTAVVPLGNGRYDARIDTGWWIERGPNGGYIAAIVMRGFIAEGGGAARPPPPAADHHPAPGGAGP